MKYLSTRISEVLHPAPGHALLRFSADQAIAGRPGEFVMVRGDWGEHPVLPRAFSLAESGASGALLVKSAGPGSALLARMEPGDELAVFGPLGRGYTVEPDGTPVLVAGGVGVAPLLFLARELAAAGRRAVFLYGARSAGELPFSDELARLAELVVTTEDGSAGERGLVSAPLRRLLSKAGGHRVYSCGPDAMLEAVAALAVAAGAPCQVALEAPMACGLGTCKGCAVRAADGDYRYVCCDGPVFQAREIYGAAR